MIEIDKNVKSGSVYKEKIGKRKYRRNLKAA
jgi:hypothetical protein